MGKKRSASLDTIESEEDQSMNGGDDNPDDNSDNDADMKETVPEEHEDKKASSRPKRNDRKLRPKQRKRRRATTGLMSPANLKKAKRARKSTSAKLANTAATDMNTSTNGEKIQTSVDITNSEIFLSNTIRGTDVNGGGDRSVHPVADVSNKFSSAPTSKNPSIVPHHEQDSTASLNIFLNDNDSNESSSSSDEEESKEINIVPPKYVPPINGTTVTESSLIVSKQSTPVAAEKPQVEAKEFDQSSFHNKGAEGTEIADENLVETSNDLSSTSTWGSTFQRLAIFVVLGYLSLLFSVPVVLKLTQDVVPLDDSILPALPIAPTIEYTAEPVDDEEVQNNDDDQEETENAEKLKVALQGLQIWNGKFLKDFEKLAEEKTGYTSSAQDLEDYYSELLGRFDKIEAQIQTRRGDVEDRLKRLDKLEELLRVNNDFENENDDGLDHARDLAQQLLGKTLLTTSSIALWNVSEEIDVACDLDFKFDEVQSSVEKVEDEEEEAPPFLTAKLLKEKESDLMLRSTITAEKFIGGALAEERIRKWVKSQIIEEIKNEEDATEVIKEIEDFVKQLSDAAVKGVAVQQPSMSQIIESHLESHRADITGIYDNASLKNGAEIIYGGKRGTSKSLIDDLPILNRILQNSNLRFYGFGPEAALTATYPPNTLGQCWSFRQTPLKEQLKERELFENDNNVPNDFKRGNFGTLTIRLSQPISVENIIIEHPPVHMTNQAKSAIRSFRVVGYEDEMASSKSWNLGSFEYSLRENSEDNSYLQRFEAATTVFGKEIPRLHAISLAVDSNYGHEYACLYRFRVHGTKE